jgi:hypothetical protein
MYRTSHASVFRELHEAGRLSSIQSRIFSEPRPSEELYDLQSDPCEIANLAGDPACAETLAGLRAILDHWMAETGDLGAEDEPAEEIQENTWYHRRKPSP